MSWLAILNIVAMIGSPVIAGVVAWIVACVTRHRTIQIARSNTRYIVDLAISEMRAREQRNNTIIHKRIDDLAPETHSNTQEVE